MLKTIKPIPNGEKMENIMLIINKKIKGIIN
jgi:hypothetical protein